MASQQGLTPTLPRFCSRSSSSSSSSLPCVSILPLHENARRIRTAVLNRRRSVNRELNRRRLCTRAMVQQATVGGASAAYARDMERLSAKESLILALNDAGGFEAYSKGKTTEMQRIDVMERITALERLNPTPRPTTSPYLEGKWNLEWFGPDTPGFFVVRFLSERLPATLANVSKLDVVIKDGIAKAVVFLSLLNLVSTKLILSAKLTPEGPLRVKEEYAEGTLESPNIIEEAVPEQVKSALAQASSAVQQLPIPFRDLLSNGLTVPLSGTFQRMFMISYLDEEILIIRDGNGLPTVFTRLDQVLTAEVESTTNYVS
ncbi:Probable plastid-lipid-associated protein 13, chloroplastic [Dionaea muscipula]